MLNECSAVVGLADLIGLGNLDPSRGVVIRKDYLFEGALLTLHRSDPGRLRQGGDAYLISKARCRVPVRNSRIRDDVVNESLHRQLQRASANSSARCTSSKDLLVRGPCRRVYGEVSRNSFNVNMERL